MSIPQITRFAVFLRIAIRFSLLHRLNQIIWIFSSTWNGSKRISESLAGFFVVTKLAVWDILFTSSWRKLRLSASSLRLRQWCAPQRKSRRIGGTQRKSQNAWRSTPTSRSMCQPRRTTQSRNTFVCGMTLKLRRSVISSRFFPSVFVTESTMTEKVTGQTNILPGFLRWTSVMKSYRKPFRSIFVCLVRLWKLWSVLRRKSMRYPIWTDTQRTCANWTVFSELLMSSP